MPDGRNLIVFIISMKNWSVLHVCFLATLPFHVMMSWVHIPYCGLAVPSNMAIISQRGKESWVFVFCYVYMSFYKSGEILVPH